MLCLFRAATPLLCVLPICVAFKTVFLFSLFRFVFSRRSWG